MGANPRPVPGPKKLDDMPEVLSIKQLHDYLGIGIHQTYDLVHRGTIRSRRVGTRFLVPREAVREYLAGSDA